MTIPIITVRGLSKKYYLPSNKGIKKIKQEEKILWALKDVNFDIYQGERVGIIGKNGAGKSTLLKILSRLVYPTMGEARIRGRVTSLLEVGTGFNDNLTGRENVYLNASLHGLQPDEIDAIFPSIVEFSEVKQFLDTPVKHYSSGMKMRLAFSVAAHLDPDILLLDEVLAVGDMSFQQKCLKRVEGLTSEGRTILFVSHSMDAIARFCDRCIWLEHGRIFQDGPTQEVMTSYVQKVMGVKSQQEWDEDEKADSQETKEDTQYCKVVSIRVINAKGETISTAAVHEPIGIEIVYDILDDSKIIQPALHVKTAKDVFAFAVAYTDPQYMNEASPIGRYTACVWIPPNLLNIGLMYVNLVMVTPYPHQEEHLLIEKAVSFNVHEIEGIHQTARGLFARDFPGVVRPLLKWETYSHKNSQTENTKILQA